MKNIQRDLIFDLGLNKGEDSSFYLNKGFRVVAVEANPRLAKLSADALSNWVGEQKLEILNVGLWDESATLTFYENQENDHWSSFDREMGSRGGKFTEYPIQCIRIGEMFSRFGVPHYLKIDIERADERILRDMLNLDARPSFVSVEEYGVTSLEDLHALGYDQFQIVAQGAKWKEQTPPNPTREGKYFAKQFTGYDSGLFGFDLPDNWVSYKTARKIFTETIRAEDFTYLGSGDWYDIHATTEQTLGHKSKPLDYLRSRLRSLVHP